MLGGGNMRFRPAIFFYSCLLNSSSNCTETVKEYFYRLYNELARALQSSITFFDTPCIVQYRCNFWVNILPRLLHA